MSDGALTTERPSTGLDELVSRLARPLPGWIPWLALGALLLIAAGVLTYETRGTLFWADEWQWILIRRGGGLGTYLDPHNEHLSLVPVILYKLLFATVGIRHYWPYRAMLIAFDLIAGGLIFIYARNRVGAWYGLLAAAMILFFGPGWQDILWPFQTAWVLTVVAGVGALLALDRQDRIGDVVACVLLAIAIGSSGPGLAIAAGMIIELLLRRRLRDLWIVAIPLALYAIWWLGYEQTLFNSRSLLLLPQFVLNSAAGTLSALTGLAQVNVYNDSGGDFLTFGVPLLVAAVAALIWRLRALGRIPPRVMTLAVIALSFWVLTGVARAYLSVGSIVLTSTGDESRYLYVGAVFVLLLAAELARTSAQARPVLAAGLGALALLAVISNIGPLRDGAGLLRAQAQYTIAELETMNMSADVINPNYVSNGFIFGIVKAEAWFAARRTLGSPPLSPQVVAAQPQFARQAADAQLVKIQGLTLRPGGTPGGATANPPTVDAAQSGSATTRAGCVAFTPTGLGSVQLTAGARGVAIVASSQRVLVGVRRFSSTFAALGTVAAGARAALEIRPDLATEPWHVELASTAPLQACGLG